MRRLHYFFAVSVMLFFVFFLGRLYFTERTSSEESKSTVTVPPSGSVPARRRSATGSSISRWISLLIGRAPIEGS